MSSTRGLTVWLWGCGAEEAKQQWLCPRAVWHTCLNVRVYSEYKLPIYLRDEMNVSDKNATLFTVVSFNQLLTRYWIPL